MHLRRRGTAALLGLAAAILLGSAGSQAAGQVATPDTVGFFDMHGTYTVIGVVKSPGSGSHAPYLTVSVSEGDGTGTVSRSFPAPPVGPSGEIPFKVRFPGITWDSPVPGAEVVPGAVPRDTGAGNLAVLYDDTLVLHDDGSLTGTVLNGGSGTVSDVVILAAVHGTDGGIMDVARSVERISLGPGESAAFSMYPDPAVPGDVLYYSCFAIGASSVKPVYTERNGDRFYFRYDSGSWYAYPEFDEEGTELRMRTQNSFPVETYASFEFPVLDESEKFDVYVNGIRKDSIQSVDEWDNWHVAFTVEPQENGDLLITGFAGGWSVEDRILVPDWMRTNALSWSAGEVDDSVFLRGVKFMISEGIIDGSGAQSGSAVPKWVRGVAALWADEQIDDATFLAGIEYLVGVGLVRA